MASDWIKSRDREFRAQANELIALIARHGSAWGLNPEDLEPLQTCQADFEAALARQTEQAAVYHTLVAEKQVRRERLERALRSMVRRINNHPGMTQALRAEMQLASPTRTSSCEEAGDMTRAEKETDNE